MHTQITHTHTHTHSLHTFIYRIPLLATTLHIAMMTPLLPITMVTSQTAMVPAALARWECPKTTTTVE